MFCIGVSKLWSIYLEMVNVVVSVLIPTKMAASRYPTYDSIIRSYKAKGKKE